MTYSSHCSTWSQLYIHFEIISNITFPSQQVLFFQISMIQPCLRSNDRKKQVKSALVFSGKAECTWALFITREVLDHSHLPVALSTGFAWKKDRFEVSAPSGWNEDCLLFLGLPNQTTIGKKNSLTSRDQSCPHRGCTLRVIHSRLDDASMLGAVFVKLQAEVKICLTPRLIGMRSTKEFPPCTVGITSLFMDHWHRNHLT